MDKNKKTNVGSILTIVGKSIFVSNSYWIPAYAGMTNSGTLISSLLSKGR